MTRHDKIQELDRRETRHNIPNRRGVLVRCHASRYYRRPPAGFPPDEPRDSELDMALALK